MAAVWAVYPAVTNPCSTRIAARLDKVSFRPRLVEFTALPAAVISVVMAAASLDTSLSAVFSPVTAVANPDAAAFAMFILSSRVMTSVAMAFTDPLMDANASLRPRTAGLTCVFIVVVIRCKALSVASTATVSLANLLVGVRGVFGAFPSPPPVGPPMSPRMFAKVLLILVKWSLMPL